MKYFNLEVEVEAFNIDSSIEKIEKMLKSRLKSLQVPDGYLTKPINEYLSKLR